MGMRPKAPAGALGGDYGDFFLQDRGLDIGFVNIRYFGTISPYLNFTFLVLFFGSSCGDWSPHSIDDSNDYSHPFP
jgi:hypothetical protein